jgi:diguanylate cyclase (GGDEF)-like protein
VSAIALGSLAALPWLMQLLEDRVFDFGGTREILDSLVTVLLGLVILHMIRREQRITRRHVEDLERLSLTDPLTGLGNRRAFERDLDLAIHRAQRTGEPIALLYLDVNGLKKVNDRYGHAAGDETLRALAAVMRSQSRIGLDWGYRVGGDEFVMVLSAAPRGAQSLADRLAHAFKERSPHGSGVSTGLVIWNGEQRLADLLREADTRMYRHKQPVADWAAAQL